MTRNKYEEIRLIKRKIIELEKLRDAGFVIDTRELVELYNKHGEGVDVFHQDAINMTPEEAAIIKCRFIDCMTYHQLAQALYGGLKSETTARKKIQRYFKRVEGE